MLYLKKEHSQKEDSTSSSPTPSVRLQRDENKNDEFPPLPRCSIPLSAGVCSKLRLIFHASITILFLFNYTCFIQNLILFFSFFFFSFFVWQVYQRLHWKNPKWQDFFLCSINYKQNLWGMINIMILLETIYTFHTCFH